LTTAESTIRQQIEEILSEPGFLTGRFGPGEREELENLSGQMSLLMSDRSLGASGGDALWLNGASVINSTITANKLVVNTLEAVTTNTGNLNVTGNFIAAASYPATAARVEINSTGIYGYSSDGVTTTFRFNVDGSGEIGPNAGPIRACGCHWLF